jgi:hypothetical protein
MPRNVYNTDAHELCRKFYCKFGGNALQIEKAMHQAGYAGWKKEYLYDKGTVGKDARLGWITKYGFEKSLELYQQTLISSVQTDEEKHYKRVEKIADKYGEIAVGTGEDADKAADRYAKYLQLLLDIRNKLDLKQSNFESFVEAWESICSWIGEISPEAAKHLLKHSQAIIERAENHYGERSVNS